MFNAGMNDAELIDSLGGPAELAKLLGFKKPGAVQRVHNWRSRGIPSKVKVDRPDLFMRPDVPWGVLREQVAAQE